MFELLETLGVLLSLLYSMRWKHLDTGKCVISTLSFSPAPVLPGSAINENLLSTYWYYGKGVRGLIHYD